MAKEVPSVLFGFLEEQKRLEVQEHLASFLKWVYENNPDFQTTLAREELTTCWLHEFQHPRWMEELIEAGNLEFIAHVNEYLEENCEYAHILSMTIQPEFKPEPAPQPQPRRWQDEPISPKQYNLLAELAPKHGRQINLKELTKGRASALISELLELERAQKQTKSAIRKVAT